MNNDAAFIHATFIHAAQMWLKTVIINYKICPFAKAVFEIQRIRFVVCHETDIEKMLLSIMGECDELDSNDTIETTLIIYANAFADFDDYLDFLALAEALLIEQRYEGIYQLASFHPNYCFEGVSIDDASNYTNRSPYPMLHLLRETSIERAVSDFPNALDIPERNIQLTQALGIEKMRALLAACFDA